MVAVVKWAVAVNFVVFPFFSGCAHYYLPTTHFNTSEIKHSSPVGELEWLMLQSGTSLTAAPQLSQSAPDSGEATILQLQKVWGQYALRFSRSFSETVEGSFRIQPSAPLVFGIKHQLVGGKTVHQIIHQNFSCSVGGAAGLLLGREGSASTSYYLIEGFLSTGYRFSPKHLVWLSPFGTFAGLSGVVSAPSSSVSQIGINLGYQYSMESLLLKVEGAWTSGAMGIAKISGITAGASVGFSL